jgi:hypothetical protein
MAAAAIRSRDSASGRPARFLALLLARPLGPFSPAGGFAFTPASGRLGAMLGFVDVNEPVAGPGTLGRNASRAN